MQRKPLSKRIRFEIFKRDGFTCIYCGSKPPSVILEVDHILAYSKGGKDSMDNLATSCFECNRGKSNKDLTSIPSPLIDNSEQTKLKVAQFKEYRKYLNQLSDIENQLVSEVEATFNLYFPNYSFNPKFRESIKLFLKKIDVNEMKKAMVVSCGKFSGDVNVATKYFCGICWSKIKEGNL